MHARYDTLIVLIKLRINRQADARHDAHVDDDVSRIGELHSDLRHGRANRSHAERQYVHGSSLHRAVEKLFQFPAHSKWFFPVIRGTSRVFRERTDESPVFDASDVTWVRTRVVTTRPEFFVE